MLKTLLNVCFLPIALDKKRKGDKYSLSRNRGVKVVGASSENAFLIILLYWPSLCFSGIGVSICRKNHVKNGRKDNPGPGTGTSDINRGADNLGIDIDISDKNDINKKTINPGTGTNTPNIEEKADDRKADDPSIGTDILNIDKKVDNRRMDNPSIDTADVNVDRDKRADPGIDIVDTDADK